MTKLKNPGFLISTLLSILILIGMVGLMPNDTLALTCDGLYYCDESFNPGVCYGPGVGTDCGCGNGSTPYCVASQGEACCSSSTGEDCGCLPPYSNYANTYADTYANTYADTYANTYSNSYSNAYSNSYSDSYSNAYSNSYSNAYSNAYSNSYSNAYSNSYSNAYSNSYSNAYSNAYSDSYSNAYSNSYSNAYSNAYANSYSNSVSFILTVNTQAGGSVKSTIPDTTFNCTTSGTPCTRSYTSGTQVTLKAVPNSSYWKFKGWLGSCTGTSSCILNMTSAKTVTGQFVPRPFIYKEF